MADAVRHHEDALKYGGARGILNEDRLKSAIARPYDGYHRLIHQKAAALVHAIVSNHGFVDGNKRTAVYLVELLVSKSGYRLVEEDDLALAETVASVADGSMDEGELVAWFKARLT